MIIKKGASIDGICSEMLVAAITIICPIFRDYGREAVVTSGSEHYKHSAKRSAHYRKAAIDWRSHWFTNSEKNAILDMLQCDLGPDFVVILENRNKRNEHYHVHWSPVYREAE